MRAPEPGEVAVSPATFLDLYGPADFRRVADQVYERSSGIPFNLSANHVKDDADFALEAAADYFILDGRGGDTSAAPLIFRNDISVPTIPTLAPAQRVAGPGRPALARQHHDGRGLSQPHRRE